MCQKPWSWQAEVPSAMGQQLTQGLPQAINQHKLTGSRTTVPRAVGNTVLSRTAPATDACTGRVRPGTHEKSEQPKGTLGPSERKERLVPVGFRRTHRGT